jgi:hypothetical protein
VWCEALDLIPSTSKNPKKQTKLTTSMKRKQRPMIGKEMVNLAWEVRL